MTTEAQRMMRAQEDWKSSGGQLGMGLAGADLTTSELMLIEQRVANASKSTGTAFLLWLFLGLLSAHRFYLGRPVSAILQIVSYFFLVGFIWLLVDGFLITGMIQEHNTKERLRLMEMLRSQKVAPAQREAA